MTDPIAQFSAWFAEAQAHPHISEPTAMTLATVGADGLPSARIVLLKGVDAEGFRFFTNYQSRKGGELAANGHAALCFYWMPLNKQVRVEGSVAPLAATESDAYFASRARERQIGAWASQQSQPMRTRDDLEMRIAEFEARFAGTAVPRPPHWGGFLLQPTRMEFWQQRDHRLHARDVFTRGERGWETSLLYP